MKKASVPCPPGGERYDGLQKSEIHTNNCELIPLFPYYVPNFMNLGFIKKKDSQTQSSTFVAKQFGSKNIAGIT